MTATNLASLPPTGLSSAEGKDGPPVSINVGRKIRFGVIFRLVIAFAAITAFAAATSAVALYTFGKYGEGFNRIASSSLPALVAASNLAQGSQALAASAPNLANTEGHFARRAISEALGSQLKNIAEAAGQIKALAPETEGLDSLTRNEASLRLNIQKLDTSVAEKIEADRVAANFMVRLRSLSIRIRTVRSELAEKIAIDQNARAQADALSAWTAAADEEIVILMSTSGADTATRLNGLRSEFAEAVNRAKDARRQFSPLLIQATDQLDQILGQYGDGSPNGFDVRKAQLSSASNVRGALLDTEQASAQFVASAEHVFADVQKDARAQSEYFAGMIFKYSGLLAALSLVCLTGAAVVFLYINRSIIQRLRRLSDSMRSSVHGHKTPISITGNDEITDMAKAADFFVTSIEQREKGLRESLQQLHALGEVSQAVNSTIDLETVLTTIVAKATQLSDTEAGAIYVFDEAIQEFRLRATYGLPSSIVAELKESHIRLGQTAITEAVERRLPIQIPDIREDPSATIDIIIKAGFRALLFVPLLGTDERVVGALIVRRKRPGEFLQSTVALLQTFAAQSALAIKNARLFERVETRTRELAKSLEELRSTQDRLIQTEKLASLGQLTAGIAHEIKNPLNFVNNFSGVSAELIDELQDALNHISIDEERRGEIQGLAETLRGNLEKIVQHGKRADAIVKNMLLHSRQDSGERRVVDTNTIVEESINLAYHSARAENKDFNIMLERCFDPTAGELDVFPQEITRVLLNVIANGFYATTTKRKAKGDGSGYEPTLAAATKNLGDSVEIRIRDNGTGIPPEVRDRMFDPFFTTKPAGEGTGLGLSISHDIVVKQHGGSIEVDTQHDGFTEITIILPRTAVLPH